MRILFVTPYIPSPIRVRPFSFIKGLSTRHQISLVALVCDEYELRFVEEISQYCVSVDVVELSRLGAYARCLRSLSGSLPLRVAYYAVQKLEHTILRVIARQNIDLLHGELLKVLPALRRTYCQISIPYLFDAVDSISTYLQQSREVGNLWQRVLAAYELQRVRRCEHEALRCFDRVVVTTERDRVSLLSSEERGLIEVIPNGVDPDYFRPWDCRREPDSLVFCAKLDYYPNQQAILRFCREVLPCIWQARPQVCLKIVGNQPPATIQALARDRRIEVTGYVPDIRPYLARAAIAIAPLQIAVGIQNKVLEAMAMGTPLVVSSMACHVLNVKNNVQAVIADDPQNVAQSILRLLDGPEVAERLGRTGANFVRTHYRWERSIARLEAIYAEMVAG